MDWVVLGGPLSIVGGTGMTMVHTRMVLVLTGRYWASTGVTLVHTGRDGGGP